MVVVEARRMHYLLQDLTPSVPGADPGFDQGGGPQIVTGLKLPFWGLSFVEFWCWGLIFGGQGGARAPGAPPGSAPEYPESAIICLDSKYTGGHP